jgi:cobalt-zinc-cadmium efflux system outer membrane protein
MFISAKPIFAASLLASALITGSTALAATAPPPGGTLTPLVIDADEAARIGLAQNPADGAARAAANAARSNYHGLSALPNPQLTLDTVSGSSAAPTLNGTNRDTFLDVSESFDTSGQRRWGAKNAKALYGAARAGYRQTQLGLVQQIRNAYWDYVAARAQSRFARESLDDVQKVNDATNVQNTAGTSPRGDVLRSNIDLANARQADLTAEAAQNTALAALNLLLARAPQAPIEPRDDLVSSTEAAGTAVPTPVPPLPPLDELTTTAQAASPAVQAALAQVAAAKYAVSQNKAARLPDITVDYEKSLQDPFHSVVVGLQLPLFDLGSIRSQVHAARSGVDQAQAQMEQAKEQVAQQVEQAYRDYNLAQTQAAGYNKEILQPSVTLLNMAQLGYHQGATGILPVLDAESTLRNARTGYINALQAIYKAQDELLAATNAPALVGLKPYAPTTKALP